MNLFLAAMIGLTPLALARTVLTPQMIEVALKRRPIAMQELNTEALKWSHKTINSPPSELDQATLFELTAGVCRIFSFTGEFQTTVDLIEALAIKYPDLASRLPNTKSPFDIGIRERLLATGCEAYSALGRFQDCALLATKLAPSPSIQAQFLLINSILQAGRCQEALERFVQLEALTPKKDYLTPWILLSKAYALQCLKNFKESKSLHTEFKNRVDFDGLDMSDATISILLEIRLLRADKDFAQIWKLIDTHRKRLERAINGPSINLEMLEWEGLLTSLAAKDSLKFSAFKAKLQKHFRLQPQNDFRIPGLKLSERLMTGSPHQKELSQFVKFMPEGSLDYQILMESHAVTRKDFATPP